MKIGLKSSSDLGQELFEIISGDTSADKLNNSEGKSFKVTFRQIILISNIFYSNNDRDSICKSFVQSSIDKS